MLNTQEFYYLLAALIGLTIQTFTYSYLTNKPIKITAKLFIIMVVVADILRLNNECNTLTIQTLTSFCIFIFYFKIVFNDSFRKALIGVAQIFIINMIIEISLALLMNTLGLIHMTESSNWDYFMKIAITFLVSFFSFLIVKNAKNRAILIKFQKKIDKEEHDLVLTLLLVLSLNIIAIYYGTIISTTYSNFYIIFILGVILSLIIYIFQMKNEELLLNIKNRDLARKNSMYNTITTNYKELNHNFNHYLLSIKSVANKEAIALIDARLASQKESYGIIGNLEIVPRGLKEVFYEKLGVIPDPRILCIDSSTDKNVIKKMKPKIYNSLCDMIGIFLDNAIEAIQTVENKQIHIYLHDDTDYLYIKIINTFNNVIDLTSIGNKEYSTKCRKSGIGLFSILKLKELKSTISIVNNKYIVDVKAPLENKKNAIE